MHAIKMFRIASCCIKQISYIWWNWFPFPNFLSLSFSATDEENVTDNYWLMNTGKYAGKVLWQLGGGAACICVQTTFVTNISYYIKCCKVESRHLPQGVTILQPSYRCQGNTKFREQLHNTGSNLDSLPLIKVKIADLSLLSLPSAGLHSHPWW